MKVLLGTTNPAKVKRFSELLSGCDVEFLTLDALGISQEPEEQGSTPEENAILKAKFYGKYFDAVICNDSGLYFDVLPLNDPRQPGLHIRSPQGERLDDDRMIDYYSHLVHSLGGKVLAYYLDGVAVCCKGNISSFMENGEATKVSAFYMVDKPSEKRHPGWPLDSISVNARTNRYFVDATITELESTEEQIILGDYRCRLIQFLKEALSI